MLDYQCNFDKRASYLLISIHSSEILIVLSKARQKDTFKIFKYPSYNFGVHRERDIVTREIIIVDIHNIVGIMNNISNTEISI